MANTVFHGFIRYGEYLTSIRSALRRISERRGDCSSKSPSDAVLIPERPGPGSSSSFIIASSTSSFCLIAARTRIELCTSAAMLSGSRGLSTKFFIKGAEMGGKLSHSLPCIPRNELRSSRRRKRRLHSSRLRTVKTLAISAELLSQQVERKATLMRYFISFIHTSSQFFTKSSASEGSLSAAICTPRRFSLLFRKLKDFSATS
mmetsp:Transcript_35297/g.77315  ORF Transcript_35297/g.77315 Transcript_35297/m.77315 type:complete len:204 (-) Transcript_35297:1211-1822(-)